MILRSLAIIINPASGADYPILAQINRQLAQTDLHWDIYLTRPRVPASSLVSQILNHPYDAVVIYGGDGTVSQITRHLLSKSLPVFILAGGTGNTLARELKIPTDHAVALNLLATAQLTHTRIDTAIANNHYFLVGAVVGPLSRAGIKADREAKDSLGMAAYFIRFVEALPELHPLSFDIRVDGTPHSLSAVGVSILNASYLGLVDSALNDNIHLSSGKLAVVAIENINPALVAKGAFSLIANQSLSNVTHTWRGTKISITTRQPTTVILDEDELTTSKLQASLNAQSLSVLVPVSPGDTPIQVAGINS